MTKREELLKNLRQAERRRKRRPTAPAPSAPSSAPIEAEEIGSAILDQFDRNPSLTDRQVAAAAQGVLQERPAKDPLTQSLQESFARLLASGRGERQRWRTELANVAETIRAGFAHSGTQGYLEYLRALAN